MRVGSQLIKCTNYTPLSSQGFESPAFLPLLGLAKAGPQNFLVTNYSMIYEPLRLYDVAGVFHGISDLLRKSQDFPEKYFLNAKTVLKS